MKLSETTSLEQVLKAHAEALHDVRYGKITWSQFLRDERRAVLRGANLTGANLTGANLTDADLTRANLTGANLTGANLTDAVLRGAVLRGANLTGANLTDAVLRGANLRDANLTGANLRDADLPFEVPVIENIDQRILDAVEGETATGTLDMSNWHTCETTHCRAGWAITFAGGEGRMMEKILGSSAAGALIYAASRPNKKIPDFFASNEEAMASIREDARA